MYFLSMNEYIEVNSLNPIELNFDMQIAENLPNNSHPWRYNLPTASEVSILIPNVIPHDARRIVVYATLYFRNGGIQSFSYYHQIHNPLQYPSLFTFGADGWNLTYLTDKESSYTLERYVIYHLWKRNNHCNFLHASNNFFQQYIVDN